MAMDERLPSLLSRALRRALVWFYRQRGWTAHGDIPDPRRFIVIAAPHTSNWDFLYFIGLTEDLGFRPHFMAKKSLFRWPFTNFLLDMGGVPVNRDSKHNYVQQMIDEFARRDQFMLTIAPEGTRSKTQGWKSGFYHIAMGANVPMVLGTMDYARKTGGLGPAIWPSGDYAADMAKIAAHYADIIPKNPSKASSPLTGLGAE